MHRGSRAILYVALALAGYIVTAEVLRSFVTLPEAYGYRARFEHIVAAPGEYDAVYIGSSLTHRSFQPTIIDPIVSREAAPFRSFNLGMGGAFFQQNDADLDFVLDDPSPRLRWIIMELPFWDGEQKRDIPEINRRTILEHSPRVTRVALASLPWDDAQDDRWRTLQIASADAGLMARWHSSAGLGVELMRGLLGLRSDALEDETQLFAERRGYRPLEDETDSKTVAARRRMLHARKRQYEEAITHWGRIDGEPIVDARSTHAFRTLESQARRIRRAGREAVWVAPPVTRRNRLLDWMRSQDLPYAVIDLSDPREQPALFVLENRFDAEHLTERGSALFSEQFAEAFGALRDARERR